MVGVIVSYVLSKLKDQDMLVSRPKLGLYHLALLRKALEGHINDLKETLKVKASLWPESALLRDEIRMCERLSVRLDKIIARLQAKREAEYAKYEDENGEGETNPYERY